MVPKSVKIHLRNDESNLSEDTLSAKIHGKILVVLTTLYGQWNGHWYAGHKKECIIMFFFISSLLSYVMKCTRYWLRTFVLVVDSFFVAPAFRRIVNDFPSCSMHRLRFKNGVSFIGATSTIVALAVQPDAFDMDSFVASVRCRRRKFLRNSGIEDSSMPSVLLSLRRKTSL